jgi:hypothetical protein
MLFVVRVKPASDAKKYAGFTRPTIIQYRSLRGMPWLIAKLIGLINPPAKGKTNLINALAYAPSLTPLSYSNGTIHLILTWGYSYETQHNCA